MHDLAWLVDDADAAFAAAVSRGARPRARAVGRERRARRAASSPRSRPTATPCTRSSTAAAIAASCSSPAITTTTSRTRPSVRRSDSRASTTSSATSSRAGSTTGCASTPRCSGFSQLQHFDDDQISHRVLGADVDGRVGRLEDRDADQRAGRRAAARARSRSTSSTTTARACSTSRCAPTTSSRPCRRCATAACGSCGCRRRTTTRRSERLAGVDLPWDELERLNILVDRDHDGLPAADLHRDDHRPSGGVLRDHRARGREGLRRGQLQGAVRGDRARPGPAREPLAMPPYRRVGDIPRKRHTLHRVDGKVAAEELMGEEGFSAASSLLYHRHSPSALHSIESIEAPEPAFTANSPLQPHHLRTGDLGPGASHDPVLGRRYLLGNDQVAMAFVAAVGVIAAVPQRHRRRARLRARAASACSSRCSGAWRSREGDYVVVPSSTTHRWLLDGARVELLDLRGARPRRPPAASTSPSAGSCSRARRSASATCAVPTATRSSSRVRTCRCSCARAAASAATCTRTIPFDVVGWDGCLYPFALSIHDFEPIVGRIHQPPPVHQTFTGPGFVVCSFVPRLYDFDPDAVKVPYHHSNVDSDEVLFYSGGDFMSRAGSGIGDGLDQPASRGLRARPAARLARAQRGQGPHRRAGRDDRHVQAARSHRRGAVGQRPHLPVVLGTPCLTRGRRSPTGPTSHSTTFRSASRGSVAAAPRVVVRIGDHVVDLVGGRRRRLADRRNPR